jgi:XTP/dITP diphosphohydrolase
MGKGTLIAQLLATVENSDAIKFDGLLNTNNNGRHTKRGHDDFGVYERFNPHKNWGGEHYLLGGELYLDFIRKFGELENLQINPHFSLYVKYRLYKMWHEIGKPRTLFIEVGGVLTDPEVSPIFTPIIARSASTLGSKVILLTESSSNGEHIKLKSIQDAYTTLLARGIEPWAIIAREPREYNKVSVSEHLEFERLMSDRIYNNYGKRIVRIISVPYFEDLGDYTQFIKDRLSTIVGDTTIKNDTTILIATKNKSKLSDFQLYLGSSHKLIGLDAVAKKIDIREGINSIEENALNKARLWSITTGMITLADDTGFYINELYGEPGVAVRRWAGELGEDPSNEEFWEYLQKKTKNLADYSCYFEQCVAIYAPNGEYEIVRNRNDGMLNKDKLALPYNGNDYPLGAAFESLNRKKTWDEMTDEEKFAFDGQFIENLNAAIARLKKRVAL